MCVWPAVQDHLQRQWTLYWFVPLEKFFKWACWIKMSCRPYEMRKDGWKMKEKIFRDCSPIECRSVVLWLMWPLPPPTPYTGCFLCLPLTTTSIFHTADICAYVLATTKDTHLHAFLAAQWCLVEVCVQKSLNDADKSVVWSITTRIQYEFMKPWGLCLSKRAFSSITHKTASRHHVMWIVTALGWYGKQMWALDINRIAWRGIEKN